MFSRVDHFFFFQKFLDASAASDRRSQLRECLQQEHQRVGDKVNQDERTEEPARIQVLIL